MVAIGAIQSRRDEVVRIAARHGASNVRLFGSVAKGRAHVGSDIDLLVHFDDDRSLVDHAALINDLENLFGCRVDVVSDDSLHRSVRDRILAEGVPL